MNLTALFQELALVELNNLSMSENGTIILQKRPQLVVSANEGLLDLHSRFILKEKDVLIEMREALTNYHLLKRYAWSQYNEDNPPNRWDLPYILDMISEPFEEDVIKILSVYNSFGMEIPLNDIENPLSVFTPQGNVLQVPFPIPLQSLSLGYQAKHTPLDHCHCDQEIVLPDVLWPALKAFIAGKTYMNMNTQEMIATGQGHMMNYETACQNAIERDLVNTSSSTTNTRFDKRGWI